MLHGRGTHYNEGINPGIYVWYVRTQRTRSSSGQLVFCLNQKKLALTTFGPTCKPCPAASVLSLPSLHCTTHRLPHRSLWCSSLPISIDIFLSIYRHISIWRYLCTYIRTPPLRLSFYSPPSSSPLLPSSFLPSPLLPSLLLFLTKHLKIFCISI